MAHQKTLRFQRFVHLSAGKPRLPFKTAFFNHNEICPRRQYRPARLLQNTAESVPFAANARTSVGIIAPVFAHRRSGALGKRIDRKMVKTVFCFFQRIDCVGMRDAKTQTHTGKGKRFGKRAHDYEIFICLQQGQSSRFGKIGIGFVDNDCKPAVRGAKNLFDLFNR